MSVIHIMATVSTIVAMFWGAISVHATMVIASIMIPSHAVVSIALVSPFLL